MESVDLKVIDPLFVLEMPPPLPTLVVSLVRASFSANVDGPSNTKVPYAERPGRWRGGGWGDGCQRQNRSPKAGVTETPDIYV